MAKRSKGEEHRIIDEKLQSKLNNAELELRRFHKQQHESLRSGVESGKINLSDIFRPTSEFERLKRIADTSACSGYSISALMRSNLTDDELETICAPEKVITYTFMSKLETQHIKALLPVVNDLVFAEPQTLESMAEWLECKHHKRVRVKKNYLLAYLMSLLANDGWICHNWQKVAEEMNVFESKKGTELKHSDLSKCLSKANQKYKTINSDIYDVVKGLKG